MFNKKKSSAGKISKNVTTQLIVNELNSSGIIDIATNMSEPNHEFNHDYQKKRLIEKVRGYDFNKIISDKPLNYLNFVGVIRQLSKEFYDDFKQTPLEKIRELEKEYIEKNDNEAYNPELIHNSLSDEFKKFFDKRLLEEIISEDEKVSNFKEKIKSDAITTMTDYNVQNYEGLNCIKERFKEYLTELRDAIDNDDIRANISIIVDKKDLSKEDLLLLEESVIKHYINQFVPLVNNDISGYNQLVGKLSASIDNKMSYPKNELDTYFQQFARNHDNNTKMELLTRIGQRDGDSFDNWAYALTSYFLLKNFGSYFDVLDKKESKLEKTSIRSPERSARVIESAFLPFIRDMCLLKKNGIPVFLTKEDVYSVISGENLPQLKDSLNKSWAYIRRGVKDETSDGCFNWPDKITPVNKYDEINKEFSSELLDFINTLESHFGIEKDPNKIFMEYSLDNGLLKNSGMNNLVITKIMESTGKNFDIKNLSKHSEVINIIYKNYINQQKELSQIKIKDKTMSDLMSNNTTIIDKINLLLAWEKPDEIVKKINEAYESKDIAKISTKLFEQLEGKLRSLLQRIDETKDGDYSKGGYSEVDLIDYVINNFKFLNESSVKTLSEYKSKFNENLEDILNKFNSEKELTDVIEKVTGAILLSRRKENGRYNDNQAITRLKEEMDKDKRSVFDEKESIEKDLKNYFTIGNINKLKIDAKNPFIGELNSFFEQKRAEYTSFVYNLELIDLFSDSLRDYLGKNESLDGMVTDKSVDVSSVSKLLYKIGNELSSKSNFAKDFIKKFVWSHNSIDSIINIDGYDVINNNNALKIKRELFNEVINQVIIESGFKLDELNLDLVSYGFNILNKTFERELSNFRLSTIEDIIDNELNKNIDDSSREAVKQGIKSKLNLHWLNKEKTIENNKLNELVSGYRKIGRLTIGNSVEKTTYYSILSGLKNFFDNVRDDLNYKINNMVESAPAGNNDTATIAIMELLKGSIKGNNFLSGLVNEKDFEEYITNQVKTRLVNVKKTQANPEGMNELMDRINTEWSEEKKLNWMLNNFYNRDELKNFCSLNGFDYAKTEHAFWSLTDLIQRLTEPELSYKRVNHYEFIPLVKNYFNLSETKIKTAFKRFFEKEYTKNISDQLNGLTVLNCEVPNEFKDIKNEIDGLIGSFKGELQEHENRYKDYKSNLEKQFSLLGRQIVANDQSKSSKTVKLDNKRINEEKLRQIIIKGTNIVANIQGLELKELKDYLTNSYVIKNLEWGKRKNVTEVFNELNDYFSNYQNLKFKQLIDNVLIDVSKEKGKNVTAKLSEEFFDKINYAKLIDYKHYGLFKKSNAKETNPRGVAYNNIDELIKDVNDKLSSDKRPDKIIEMPKLDNTQLKDYFNAVYNEINYFGKVFKDIKKEHKDELEKAVINTLTSALSNFEIPFSKIQSNDNFLKGIFNDNNLTDDSKINKFIMSLFGSPYDSWYESLVSLEEKEELKPLQDFIKRNSEYDYSIKNEKGFEEVYNISELIGLLKAEKSFIEDKTKQYKNNFENIIKINDENKKVMKVFSTLKHPSNDKVNNALDSFQTGRYKNSIIDPLMDVELKSVKLTPPVAKKKEHYTISIKDLLSLKR